MSELMDFYRQQANAQRSTIPWLRQIQEKALADFTRIGFPVRVQEDWKYTVVDSFLQQRFLGVNNTLINDTDRSLPIAPVPIERHAIALINGRVVGAEALEPSFPPGVVVQSLSQALVEHADKIKPYLSRILKQQHGFQAFNTAMLSCGLFVYVPEGVDLTAPLVISHWQDKAEQATYVRHLVLLGEGSSASIIEDYQGEIDSCYFTNTITEVSLASRAALTHYKIQRESKASYHIGHLAVKQAADSQFDSHSVSIGGKLVRSDITIGLQEPGASCLMNGLYVASDLQHIDHHTLVNHEAPSCRSAQDYKGILSGHSRAVFNGRVIVAKGAQHTEAKQQNKNLLLSKNTEIDTKPQLEIFADDVVCTHGATVGQLDEDALFYFATRGIGRAEAIRYLVQAFTVENLRAITNIELAEWINSLLNAG